MFAMAQGVYAAPVSDVPTLRLLRKALAASYDSLKEPALIMEWDFSTFSKALHGLAPMDLNRLARLSLKFWFRLFRLVIAAKLHAQEVEQVHEKRSA